MDAPKKRGRKPTPRLSIDKAQVEGQLAEILKPIEWEGADGRKLTLTMQQTRLVHALSEGVSNWSEAARMAGYASSAGAHQAFNAPHVQEAYVNLLRKRSASIAGVAISTLDHLLRNAKSEKVRLDAAIAVLNRIIGAEAEPAGVTRTAGGVKVNMIFTHTPSSDAASAPFIDAEPASPGVSTSQRGGGRGGSGENQETDGE